MSVKFIIPASIIFIYTSLLAGPDKQIDKTFDVKKNIDIDLAIGDCTLENSPDEKIHVRCLYTYDDDDFNADFNERTNSLTIKEKFRSRNPDGHGRWTIALPPGLEVDLGTGTGDLIIDVEKIELKANSGTGDIELKNATGEFKLNSGTGNIMVKDCNGEFDLNSGTGRINIENTKGSFDANSGTSTVKAFDITVENEGEFNSGTGNVEVVRPSGQNFDLMLNSGTNDAILDMDGRKLEGFFEFKADRHAGRIRADLKFDKEDDFGKNIVKSVTIGKDSPRYFISTGTGSAELKK